MSDNHNTTTTGGVLAAFTIGALAGAGIALLYAPHSGKETRRLISRRANDALDGVKDAAHVKHKQLTTALHAGRRVVRNKLTK